MKGEDKSSLAQMVVCIPVIPTVGLWSLSTKTFWRYFVKPRTRGPINGSGTFALPNTMIIRVLEFAQILSISKNDPNDRCN